MRSYVIATVVLLGLIAAAQFTRFLVGWTVVVAGIGIPDWVSAVAAVIAGSLSAWGVRVLLKTRSSTTAA